MYFYGLIQHLHFKADSFMSLSHGTNIQKLLQGVQNPVDKKAPRHDTAKMWHMKVVLAQCAITNICM